MKKVVKAKAVVKAAPKMQKPKAFGKDTKPSAKMPGYKNLPTAGSKSKVKGKKTFNGGAFEKAKKSYFNLGK